MDDVRRSVVDRSRLLELLLCEYANNHNDYDHYNHDYHHDDNDNHNNYFDNYDHYDDYHDHDNDCCRLRYLPIHLEWIHLVVVDEQLHGRLQLRIPAQPW